MDPQRFARVGCRRQTPEAPQPTRQLPLRRSRTTSRCSSNVLRQRIMKAKYRFVDSECRLGYYHTMQESLIKLVLILVAIASLAVGGVLLIIPGPTILTVISYSIAYGRRANLPLVAGVALGDSTALTLSILGLGALMAASAFWFGVVKWIGSLYMLYLGIKLLRSGESASMFVSLTATESRWKLFTNTYLVTALNPKGIAFFVAFLPHFVSPHANAAHQLWILAITFVCLATLNSTLYTIFATSARQVMSSPRAQHLFNLAGGALLTIAGIWALMAKRPT